MSDFLRPPDTLEPHFRSGMLAWYRLAALLVSVVAVGRIGFEVLPAWRSVRGWRNRDPAVSPAILIFVAAAGGLLAIKTPAALTLALWVATFVGPFLIVAPFFYRYRAPIGPILSVLAVFAAWKVLGIGFRKLRIGGCL